MCDANRRHDSSIRSTAVAAASFDLGSFTWVSVTIASNAASSNRSHHSKKYAIVGSASNPNPMLEFLFVVSNFLFR